MKLLFQPINDAHSIVELVFFLNFSSNLRKEDILGIKEIFNEKYKKFNKDTPVYKLEHKVKFNEEDTASIDSKKTTFSGFELESLDERGELNWGLSLSENKFLVHCLNYSSWEVTLDEIIGYISDVLEFLKDNDTLLISNFGLKYLDRFVYSENIEESKLVSLFNRENIFLAKNILESGDVWHSNTGWFEDMPEDFIIENSYAFKCLNQLGVESKSNGKNNDIEEIIVSIDHGCFLIPKKVIENDSKYGIEVKHISMGYINKCFNFLHDKNKIVLKGLLSDSMSKRINLY